MSIFSLIAVVLFFTDMTVLNASPRVEVINSDSFFPEGPVWVGKQVYYVEYSKHRIMHWDGEKNEVFWHEKSCGPAGLVWQQQTSSFYLTCYDAGSVLKIGAEGNVITRWTKSTTGHSLEGPNDLATDMAGGVYLTTSGKWDTKAPIAGKVWYIAASGDMTLVTQAIHYANGIAISPDSQSLYVAEMLAQRILRFDVEHPGKLGERFLFARMAAYSPTKSLRDGYFGPDGLKIGPKGNLYVAQFQGSQIDVIGPEGTFQGVIQVPAPYVTNLAFSTDGELIITAATDAWTEPYPGIVLAIREPQVIPAASSAD